MNQNKEDLSISVTSFSCIKAWQKPLSTRKVENAKKIVIMLTNPNSEGGRHWAMMNVQSICIPILENLSNVLHIVPDMFLFMFIINTKLCFYK